MDAILENYRTADFDERLRAALTFLQKLTLHPEDVDEADGAALIGKGVSPVAAADLVVVCALLNMIDRLSDALDFALLESRSEWSRHGRQLYRLGYRLNYLLGYPGGRRRPRLGSAAGAAR